MQYERCSFQIDLQHCPNCGGELKVIATIPDATVIERILDHLGLPARPPPELAGARPDAAGGLTEH